MSDKSPTPQNSSGDVGISETTSSTLTQISQAVIENPSSPNGENNLPKGVVNQAPKNDPVLMVQESTKEKSAFEAISGIDCQRPTAEYQTLVCSDAPLRKQEDRILSGLRARLDEYTSAAEASRLRSMFSEFRMRLNDCKMKFCVERAYDEFEKQAAK